ncbi:Retrovirus-related Pol polyprotein from transposon [Dictyocoela muelleri]|nr:Retrovirus-related Pol polyprotein from transposon [Dictyocoela muelleri]
MRYRQTVNLYLVKVTTVLPIAIRDDAKMHIEELSKNGIIEEAETSYISPSFFVKKSNGKLRLIIDYRNLNNITIKAHNLRPKITDIFSGLKGKKVFSKIDLSQGFYQIKIREEDLYKTGFRVLGKTYVFKRMPFGLSNAPYTFQTALGKVIDDLLNTYSYIDDILVASDDLKSHIEDLNHILSRLNEHNFGINFDKCEFAKSSVVFLGHIISQDGIRPETSKVDTFKYREPKTRKQLERLLGFINWFREYIPNAAEKLSEFYDILKIKNKTFKWTDENKSKMNEIFDEIKKQNLLHFPDLNK